LLCDVPIFDLVFVDFSPCFLLLNSLSRYTCTYEQLQNFIEKQFDQIQCGRSGVMVDPYSLIDDVVSKEYQKNSIEKNDDRRAHQIYIAVGDNSSVGNIMLDNTIQNSYNKISAANIPIELKDTLKKLAQAVDTMNRDLPEEIATEVADDLLKLVDEATKKSPNKKWYSVSIDGLTKAAENLGKVGEPVIELSRKVLSLLTMGAIK
jgi:hypothetical protein